MNKNILKEAALLHPEKVMYPYDEMLKMDGPDAAFNAVCAFVEGLSGTTVYVPNLRRIFSECLVEAAAKEYNGYNIACLAKKYGFSERGLKKGIESHIAHCKSS